MKRIVESLRSEVSFGREPELVGTRLRYHVKFGATIDCSRACIVSRALQQVAKLDRTWSLSVLQGADVVDFGS